MKAACLLFALALTSLVGCKPGLHEECDEVAVEGECTDELICASIARSSKPVCQQLCFVQQDCPTNTDCVGVDGDDASSTLRACRPRRIESSIHDDDQDSEQEQPKEETESKETEKKD